MEIVGENIRLLREKKKLTQKELAEKLGVSRQAICMWETGKRELSLTTLNRLSEVLGVPIKNLIGGIMAKKGEKNVKFQIKAPTATKVAVTGDFNSWDSQGIPLKKDRRGVWSTEISLKPGKYQYKFLVDGQWVTDPENKVTVKNPFGTENSVKEVL
ncbi:MAG: helix-turn-helix domain-containing protein [Candidatus Omnitrophica bacterium]|nr:helix-turn-helix domain-containing protein [Candidatus Omnitrophota bacterium]